MISVHFKGKSFNIIVIQVYAPTSNAEEAEVEWLLWRPTRPFRTNTQKRCPLHFRGLECKCRKLRATWIGWFLSMYGKNPLQYGKVISLQLIKINEKKKRERDTWSNRQIGLRVQNEAGQGLTEFFQENALVIANTIFQQHKRRPYTWTSSDGQYQNQIDYILCSQRWRSSI